MTCRRKANESGFILITVLLLLVLMAVSVFSVNYYTATQQRMSMNHGLSIQNGFKRQAVLQESLWEVLSNPCYRTSSDGETVTFDGSDFTRTILDSEIDDYEDTVVITVIPEGATQTLTRGYHYFCETIDLDLETALSSPDRVALDDSGNLYISDTGNNRVLKRDSAGNVTVFAGTETQGFSGDGGAATSATLNVPCGICTDAAGNVYIADRGNQRIRCVDTGGIITTVAGNGYSEYSGDGGDATEARLNKPYDVAYHEAGSSLYIADMENSTIRKVAAGAITTVAGMGQTSGYSGDGGTATSACLNKPRGVFVTSDGVIYIADTDNYRIRQVDTEGIITTVAGNGSTSYSGDGVSASATAVNKPRDMAVDSTGNLFIADTENNRIRLVCASDGIIRTIAGESQGATADVRAVEARFYWPCGIALTPDLSGKTIYVCDTYNNAVRTISLTVDPYF